MTNSPAVAIFPSNLTFFENQIAGHVYQKDELTIRMMKDSEGSLVKPYVTLEEVNFYDMLHTTTDPLLMELKQYVPAYLGTTYMKFYDEDICCIRMEDVTKNYELPCIIDIKIGKRTWLPDAPENIITRRKAQYVAMRKSLGFYIPGFQYYSQTSGSLVRRGREFAHRMLPQEAIHVLYNFVHGETGIKCGLVESILQHLRKIHSWFRRQKRFSFFDSSILLVNDAKDFKSWNGRDFKLGVRMIDFAKVVQNTGSQEDENYLCSLERLIYVLENLADIYREMMRDCNLFI